MKPTSKRRTGLLPRQELFCAFVAAGMSGTDAWLKAGYKVERETARRNASESLTKPDVAARVAELQTPKIDKALLSRDRKRELLMQEIEEKKFKPADWLRAIELDAKLAGHFAPEQVTVEAGRKTLDGIKERAERVASVLNLRARMKSAAGSESNGANGPSLLSSATCARRDIAQRV
ncbi:MAG: terminase small subunit [Verrucomicrobia bacterium]|nr:terminase small subunit [Verrucomicrobiota bacterium]